MARRDGERKREQAHTYTVCHTITGENYKKQEKQHKLMSMTGDAPLDRCGPARLLLREQSHFHIVLVSLVTRHDTKRLRTHSGSVSGTRIVLL